DLDDRLVAGARGTQDSLSPRVSNLLDSSVVAVSILAEGRGKPPFLVVQLQEELLLKIEPVQGDLPQLPVSGVIRRGTAETNGRSLDSQVHEQVADSFQLVAASRRDRTLAVPGYRTIGGEVPGQESIDIPLTLPVPSLWKVSPRKRALTHPGEPVGVPDLIPEESSHDRRRGAELLELSVSARTVPEEESVLHARVRRQEVNARLHYGKQVSGTKLVTRNALPTVVGVASRKPPVVAGRDNAVLVAHGVVVHDLDRRLFFDHGHGPLDPLRDRKSV